MLVQFFFFFFFFWQWGQELPPHDSSSLLPGNVTEDYLIDPILMAANLKKGWRKFYPSLSGPNLTLRNCMEDTFIYSGEYIKITTDYLENLPLPDEQFIFLQWTLHRLAVPCAAVGYQSEDDYIDDINEFPESPTSTAGDQEWDYTVSQLL